jgi:N-acetylneuraminate synthase
MIRINETLIGPDQPVYVIAELSGNHNGSLDRAIETVRAAAQSGAHALKLQTYRPDTITLDSNGPDFVVPGTGPWAGRTLFDLYDEAHTPWEWHEAIFTEARELGLDVFSTPFDDTAVDLLEDLGAPAFKIASFEMNDDALLRRVASTGKPVIMSTGMASLEEIMHAVGVLRSAGCEEIAVLRCTSSYPAPDASMNLLTMPVLATATGCIVGLSDHSLGSTAAIVATTLGACLVEKHFTLSRADGGVDSHFSMEPAEFAQLVIEIRRAREMRGEAQFGASLAEEGSVAFRRSLYVVRDIEAGETLTPANVRSIRPGYGLSPRYLDLVLGRAATCAVKRGTALDWRHVFRDGSR